jgi:hypothetical protein
MKMTIEGDDVSFSDGLCRSRCQSKNLSSEFGAREEFDRQLKTKGDEFYFAFYYTFGGNYMQKKLDHGILFLQFIIKYEQKSFTD